MENTLVVALTISAIGMTLLFLTLALFYGLMSLLTKVIKDPEPEPTPTAIEPPSADREEMLQAAAIAVALARAEQELLTLNASAGEQVLTHRAVSPWWTFHHQRQAAGKPTSRRIP